MAAAFAAPIGGVLFTIEEGLSFYSTSVFWRGFLATCIAVLTLHFLVELTVRWPSLPTFADRWLPEPVIGQLSRPLAFWSYICCGLTKPSSC